jgi:hypothetical protein
MEARLRWRRSGDEGAVAEVELRRLYPLGAYSIRVVPSRNHRGFDGEVVSRVGVVAESNGWPTPAAAFAGAKRELEDIAERGTV